MQSASADRYVKRHIFAPPHSATVQVGPGFAREAEAEIRSLVEDRITPAQTNPTVGFGSGRVSIRHIDYRSLLEVVLRSSCAVDLALVIGRGHAENERQLAQTLAKVDWHLFLAAGSSVHVHGDSSASRLYHTGILLDAATAVLEHHGCTLSAEAGTADQVVNLRLNHDRFQVSLSLAGRPLWQRGYRAELTAVAPLREDLAQCAVRRALSLFGKPSSGAPPGKAMFDVLFVPFAGSGTLAFESILAIYDVPPFIFRDAAAIPYAFEHFAFGTPPSVRWLRKKLVERLCTRLDHPMKVVLVDSHAPACDTSRRNWERFTEALPSIVVPDQPSKQFQADFRNEDVLMDSWHEYIGTETRSVFIPMNPPFGIRVKGGASMYERIGRSVEALAHRAHARGTAMKKLHVRGFILCADEQSWHAFMRAVPSFRCHTSHFTQGGLDVRLCVFESQ